MKSRNIVSQGETAFLCPTAFNALETGIICCLLDDTLTFLWGNSSFFEKIHYTREDFHLLFHSLSQYYAAYPDDFAQITEAVSQAQENGSRLQLTVRLPLQDGGFLWGRLNGAVMEDSASGSRVLQA